MVGHTPELVAPHKCYCRDELDNVAVRPSHLHNGTERTCLEIRFGDQGHDILTNFESCASPFHDSLPIYGVLP
jgi:hypothetical protein